jgi:hypothetical protein
MRWRAIPTLALVSLGLLSPGCQRASDEGDTKRVPRPPPPETESVPAALKVEVTIDGATAPAIDAARLQALPPDFSDQDRRAWKLGTLLGAPALRPGAVVAAAAREGPEVLLRQAAGDAEPQAVLMVSRRGDVVATMLDPKAPFPEYHGRGGRLGRAGDSLPRVVDVVRLRVFVDPK